jgi:hypothetical protein
MRRPIGGLPPMTELTYDRVERPAFGAAKYGSSPQYA